MKSEVRMLRALVLSVVMLALIGCHATGSSPPARSYVTARMPTDPAAYPFSDAVRTGNTLYLSGQIGVDQNLRVPETAEEEAIAVLNAIRSILEGVGMTMDDLVYVQVFCSDVSNYDVFNRVYRAYFRHEFPARAFIGSGPLLFGARFEVQGIAVKR
jgi:2-iminobutanoate/2-iminopropanoate deaminase